SASVVTPANSAGSPSLRAIHRSAVCLARAKWLISDRSSDWWRCSPRRDDSCKQPLLPLRGLNALASDIEVLSFDLDPYELPAHICAGDAGRAGPHERVKHNL